MNLLHTIRRMLDRRAEAAAVALLESEAQRFEQRIAEARLAVKTRTAKRAMGAKYVGHPGYMPTPRHSSMPERYFAARREYLEFIRDLGAVARRGNGVLS